MEKTAIELKNVRKTYRVGLSREFKTAIEELSLVVEAGGIFGLLGPNGAGKTTTLKILLGFVFPDEGSGTMLGRPIGDRQAHERIGFLPEQPYFYNYLKAEKALDLYGRFFGLSRASRKSRSGELLDTVGLGRNSHLTLDKYSKGMLQRFGIAQALLNDPELVIMDEPSSGLDPIGQKEVRDILLRLKDQGKTIFLSSHQLSEVENICDSVSIINRGKSVMEGNLSEILISKDTVKIVLQGDVTRDMEQLKRLSAGFEIEGDTIKLEARRENVYDLLEFARKLDMDLISSEPFRRSLEDIFLELVQDTGK
ncbi:MAG: ABC transporter ATP-binding protein [Actinobacteria bacterium]|nr:ABC transporter ATP-binding protein [Actinomycetota bacterium]